MASSREQQSVTGDKEVEMVSTGSRAKAKTFLARINKLANY